MRVDVYGWTSGGDPARAASMAREDARLSHTANGVYAAMFMAAAHAASLWASSPSECAEAGLAVVPHESRLAEAIRFARDLEGEWEDRVDALYERYGDYHWVHAINNTALVAAVLYAFDDFSPAICAVVQGGWDTDTNGAAVGSIFGALRPIEERWSEPLHGRFSTSLPSFDGDLARRARRTNARRRMTTTFDPLVPRPIDLPTPISGELDGAKIIAAPDDPAEWPAWRDALARWRDGARAGYDGSAYERLTWTQSCFSVALVWLWDERLYDHEAQRFTPERLLDEADAEFGGYDGIVLWHAYPVIGIDERNQFDWYRDVPGDRRARRVLPGSAACACSSTTTRGTSARAASRSATRRRSPSSCTRSAPTASSSTR